MPETSDLLGTLERLSKVLNTTSISYSLIGGLAVILRGYDRSTRDVDAVLWEVDDRLPQLVENLKRDGFSFRIPDGEQFARRNRVLLLADRTGTEADLSMGLLPFEGEVIQRATKEKISPTLTIPVATAEDLVVMKLVASRDRDMDDVRRLLELHPDIDPKRIRKIVTEFAEILENEDLIVKMNQVL